MSIRPRLRIVGIAGVIAVLLTGLTMVGFAGNQNGADDVTVQGAEEALESDASAYAEHFGVDIETAKRNLQLHKPAGELEVSLAKNEPDTYAGQWLEHVPEFKVVVRFTDGDASRVQPYVADGPLEEIVEVRQAEFSLKQLEESQRAASDMVSGVYPIFESQMDVMENRVEIMVLERAKLESLLADSDFALPDGVEIVEVDEHDKDDVAEPSTDLTYDLQRSYVERVLAGHNPLWGGFWASTCTTGFAVRHNQTNTTGILTAGHCQWNQSAQGHPLPYVQKRNGQHYDVQWHTSENHPLYNRVWAPGGAAPTERQITGMVSWSAQPVNAWVCLWGSRTGKQTCGQIISKWFQPSDKWDDDCNCWITYELSFVRVEGNDLSRLGDSGGPWYNGNDAWGVHKGGGGSPDGTRAHYMPVNRIYVLDLSLITWCPSGGCS